MLRTLARPLVDAGRRIWQNRLVLSPGEGNGGVIRREAVIEWRLRYFCSAMAASGPFTGSEFRSLTDTRFPKRKPSLAPRRKRASLRPPGPYAWVHHAPGEPAPSSQPNKGSIMARGRKAKKRINKVKAFILSEKKKRQAQYAESRKKKRMERIERKMAAVAREKAWAQRLAELQQLEAAKKSTTLAS